MIFPTVIESKVLGIPAQIKINRCDFHKGNSYAMDPDSFYDNYDLDYEILDRNGVKAMWLENKVDSEDYRQELDEYVIEEVKNMDEEVS